MINAIILLTIGLLAATSTFAGTNTGDVIKGGKFGPNLWGVIGRQAGSYPEYKYGKSIFAAGNAGFLWDEVSFLAYIKNPKTFWREKLNDPTANSKMAFKMKKSGRDIFAYILSISSPPEVNNEESSTSN